jgi:formylmethanofuran dehydrogenase subunit E
MQYPDFYTKIEPIKLYDPLSDFLGAFDDGIVEVSYLDCVKQAGHSCPTVAGAYLMAKYGLKTLFPDSLPQRSSVKICMRQNKVEGVTGVIANVISFIVGSSDEAGFKGMQGKFARNNLLSYNQPMHGEITLTRTDTGASITLSYDPSPIPVDEKMKLLMGKCLKEVASNEEKLLFKTLWQSRVEKILLRTDLHDQIITIKESTATV